VSGVFRPGDKSRYLTPDTNKKAARMRGFSVSSAEGA
jgi:hypothetical protein